jgi:ABC-type multidrug transport system fused ATPase/permease subunit
LNELIKEGK